MAGNWAHAVADGQSGLHFMKSWSELARGAQVSLLPDHQRDLVKPRDPPVSSNPFMKSPAVSPGARMNSENYDEDSKLVATEKSTGEVKSEVDNLTNSSGAETKPQQPTIVPKMVEFTKNHIAKMKKQALDSGANTELSRADCLSTHIWRSIAQARNLPVSSRLRLIILVDGRKKLSLPPGYFGNVIGIIAVTTTVNELIDGPFGITASLIHSGISSATAEWFQDVIDFMHLRKPGQPILPGPKRPRCEMGVSYLIRFPFYELDFGFGIPAHSMRNTLGAWDGLVFVVPSSHGPDHMVGLANLDPDAMSRFVSMVHHI